MDKHKKVRIGSVISNKMNKTVVVKVERLKRHPLYHKIMRREGKFKAHDEKGECKIGDLVKIVETRPLSREKRWRVDEIISRGEKKVELVESPPVNELRNDSENKEHDTAVHQA